MIEVKCDIVFDRLKNYRKYKTYLKKCMNCKYLNFMGTEENMFCKIYNGVFLGKCPSRVIKTGDK